MYIYIYVYTYTYKLCMIVYVNFPSWLEVKPKKQQIIAVKQKSYLGRPSHLQIIRIAIFDGGVSSHTHLQGAMEDAVPKKTGDICLSTSNII